MNIKESTDAIRAKGNRMDLSSSEDIKKLSERIKFSYHKFAGRNTDADDCIQSVLCRMLEGKHQHATIDQAVIDYLRKQSGRKGSPGYEPRRCLANADLFSDGQYATETSVDDGGELDCRRVIDAIIENSRGKIGEIVALTMEGINQREAGNKMFISESRVSQYLREVKEKSAFLKDLPQDVLVWAVRNAL